jgi:hypothetical protein
MKIDEDDLKAILEDREFIIRESARILGAEVHRLPDGSVDLRRPATKNPGFFARVMRKLGF